VSGTRAVIVIVIVAASGCQTRRQRAEQEQERAAAAVDTTPKPPAPPKPMSLSASGQQRYADSAFTVSCVVSESEGEQLLQVEGIARGAHVNFTIYNAREGSAPIGNYYTKRRAKTRVGNMDVTVNSQSFADGGGKATITDPYGRTGSLTASNFIKMGAKKGASHRAELSVRVRWRCE
jgi:hypothetical protein